MRHILFILLLLALNASAQNHIVNGDFESYTTLPTTQGQMTASNWYQVVLSADYMYSGSYGGWSPQTGGAYEGNGWAGFASYGNAGGSSEAIAQNITSNPLDAGSGYFIEFYAKRSPSGSYSDICGGVDVYGFNTAPPTNVIADHPINMGGELLFSSATVDHDLWQKKEGCFVPTQQINYVVLCVTYNPNCGQYIYVDSLSISTGASSGGVLNLNANFCAGDTVILDASTAGAPYLWQDGSTNSTYTATQEGLYWVQAQGTCGLVTDTIYLSGTPAQSSMIGDTLICDTNPITLNAGSNTGATYLWNDGSTDSTYQVSQSGTYWVEITNSCGITTDSINVNYFQSQALDLGPDQTFCNGNDYTVDLNYVNTAYLWSNGSTDSSITFTQSGTYWVNATNVCGSQSDTILITVLPNPNVNLGPDQTVCLGETTTLSIYPLGNTFEWYDGNNFDSTVIISEAGQYWVTVYTAQCGDASDTIFIDFEDCTVYDPIVVMPNVFTPNGDQNNAVFLPVVAKNLETFEMIILNRWGNVMFTSNSSIVGWDGTSGGRQCPEGTYFWTVKGVGISEQTVEMQGIVTLVR